jgi:hypothetical protein
MESDEALALDYFSGLIERARDDDELRHALFKICNDNNYALIDIEFWRPRTNEKPTDAEHEAVEQFRLLVTAPFPFSRETAMTMAEPSIEPTQAMSPVGTTSLQVTGVFRPTTDTTTTSQNLPKITRPSSSSSASFPTTPAPVLPPPVLVVPSTSVTTPPQRPRPLPPTLLTTTITTASSARSIQITRSVAEGNIPY